jgi:large subunit ribosomal protein L3
MTLILGRKRGMTQLFEADGTVVPVTVVEAGPCVVCQLRTEEKDGYNAVQIGFEDVPDRLVKKPQRGQFARAEIAPKRFLREERLTAAPERAVGDTITVGEFAEGDVVDVVGTSKGRGFAGTIKRHGFSRGAKTHGCMNYREPGSIGQSAYPGRVFKGQRMAGRFGGKRKTVKNLRVVRIDAERNLMYVTGAIPGPNGGMVQVRTARTGQPVGGKA